MTISRRDFMKYTALTTALAGSGLLSGCIQLGKPPGDPTATEEDIMKHFAYNPVRDTLDSLGDKVTYFSNKEEFNKEFYQEHLPAEERQNVMAGFSFEKCVKNGSPKIYANTEAALAWFITNEFPDLDIMWNLLGRRGDAHDYDRAESMYNLQGIPALIFGEKNEGVVKRHEGLLWTPNEGYFRNGLNFHGGPDSVSNLRDILDYYREAIPKHLGLQRQPWTEGYSTSNLENTLHTTRRGFLQVPFSYLKA